MLCCDAVRHSGHSLRLQNRLSTSCAPSPTALSSWQIRQPRCRERGQFSSELASYGNPERIQSEAALAKLCDVCPILASSGRTNRMRLNRGGNRQAKAPLSTASPLCACAMMREPKFTQLGAPRKAKPDAKSCVASSAKSSAKYIAPCACRQPRSAALDKFWSINAIAETINSLC
nr:transposase [Roseovarius gahaiensis]